MNEKVILLAAHPRSGSSWFGNLLNSHAGITYRHEPLARLTDQIGQDVIDSLKYTFGISSADYDKVLSVLRQPYHNVDRPPFFVKNGSSLSPQIQAIFWMITAKIPALTELYRYLIQKAVGSQGFLVLKETGWCVHLPSIAVGLNPVLVLLLLRHPCGFVHSMLRGIKNNLMATPDMRFRKTWFACHKSLPAVKSTGYIEQNIVDLSDIEFLALIWRTFFDVWLDFHRNGSVDSRIVIYESLQSNTLAELDEIFSSIGLRYDSATIDFLEDSTSFSLEQLPLFSRDGSSKYYSVYRNGKIDTRAWERYFTGEEISVIRQVAGKDNIEMFWDY